MSLFDSSIPQASSPGSESEARQLVPASRKKRSQLRFLAFFLVASLLLTALAVAGLFGLRRWVHNAALANLPQLDGSVSVPGLTAPVAVQRDAHGVPHLRAANLDDLLIAQGYVTAQDRLFQMDLLRRHAAGELAAILGKTLLPHDRAQRTLQIRATAGRALAALPPDQLHQLEMYARGVNAAIAEMNLPERNRLPIEFRLLRYNPAPWTPRDSMLVGLAMFQDLTTSFPEKIAREALTARLPPELAADLYPVGSWRDHPPAAGIADLTLEGPPLEDVPLDESQNDFAKLELPKTEDTVAALHQLERSLGTVCPSCTPGSNNWVVSGARTASGKPLLSNDMHLHLSEPETWYEISLESELPDAEAFHVAGVSLPGVPFIVVGHNRHIAWGFTYLYADVQDLYIENTRGTGASAEFESIGPDGNTAWQPIVHHTEVIEVRGGKDIAIEIECTRHSGTETPILTPILPGEKRSIALRWTAYEPGVVALPLLAMDSAHDWPSFLAAFGQFGGPAQNVVYADDQGHIGYHAIGRVPVRGPPQPVVFVPPNIAAPAHSNIAAETNLLTDDKPGRQPLATGPNVPPMVKPPTPMIGGPLSAVPVHPTPQNEWSGFIPFDRMPQVFDPPSGILATANSRVAPDDYPYPLTLNWAAPYRNDRIWHVLSTHDKLTATDMLALQDDIYSDFNRVLAQRFSYAIDHSKDLAARPQAEQKPLRQAADILRKWKGRMDANAAAPAIVASAHAALWPILLSAHVAGKASPKDLAELYLWGEKDYALEQIVMHQPARWLPKPFKTWDDLLASAVDKGLLDAHAPRDLGTWQYGAMHRLDIEHPVFGLIPYLRRILAIKTGTGRQPLSGDHTTVKQVDRSFGPSERLTVDFANLDDSTLDIVLGESGNPLSPWFLDQFPAWYRGATYKLPFSEPATANATFHTLTLTP